MYEVLIQANPDGTTQAHLVAEGTDEQVVEFKWMAKAVKQTDGDFRVSLETRDGKQGTNVTTMPANNPQGALDETLIALFRKANEEGFETQTVRLVEEQEPTS